MQLWILFRHKKANSKWNLCRQRVAVHARTVEGIIELNQFEVDDQVIKKNKLKGITEITLNLDELDNSDNLKDERPSNELLTYHVTDNEGFTCFEPDTPQYKNLKNGKFTSLNLRITDQNNNIITDGPQVTVVLHICECK